MNKFIEAAFAELDRLEVSYDSDSLARYGTQGIMSEVYHLAAQPKDLIIHIKRLTLELRYFGMPQKLKIISDATLSLPHLPLSQVLFYTDIDDYAVFAQTKLPGHAAGSVELKDDTIILTWSEPHSSLFKACKARLVPAMERFFTSVLI